MSWLYFTDPVQDKPSVSLTMGVLSSFILIVVGLLQVFGKVSSTGPFMEMFWGSWSLYFARRFTFGGKDYGEKKDE